MSALADNGVAKGLDIGKLKALKRDDQRLAALILRGSGK